MFKDILLGAAAAIGIGGEPDIDRNSANDFLDVTTNFFSGIHTIEDRAGIPRSDAVRDAEEAAFKFTSDTTCENAQVFVTAMDDASRSVADMIDEFGIGDDELPGDQEIATFASYEGYLSDSFTNALKELQEKSPGCDLNVNTILGANMGMTNGS